MNIKDIIAWCIAHPELAVVAAGALLDPRRGLRAGEDGLPDHHRAPREGPAWTVLDVVVEVLPNLPGAINRAVRGRAPVDLRAARGPPPAPSKVPASIAPTGGA